VWLRPDEAGDVVYVGATGLPPAARVWLHLHHDDPRVGRVRAEHPEALSGGITIRAFRLHPALERKLVKQVVVALLNEEQLDDVDDDTSAVASAIVARLAASHDAPIVDEDQQRIRNAKLRAQITEGRLDAANRWREVCDLVATSATTSDAIEALTQPPTSYTTVVASHVVDMPLRGLTSDARAGLTAELLEISEFVRHSQGD
jgi:hypothetical protein